MVRLFKASVSEYSHGYLSKGKKRNLKWFRFYIVTGFYVIPAFKMSNCQPSHGDQKFGIWDGIAFFIDNY